ncbi:NAD-dependent epimerase/dehydratase family protein [Amycolatopsis anabasis]|uniref:NAD-dependent epimerase/dehydratase family protein n=1 Tax=Amycolatopsis anabasis TaxID=1840409 RepID=UPI00131E6010|nr:NAD(P)-dependent oxidoreductase [Amycolatopsis anabasis]
MGAARVLLFGASGFIGRPVAEALRRDARVETVIPVGRTPRAGFLRHDLYADGTGELATLLRGVKPRVVINCAGRLSGGTAALVEAHVLATARLLDAMTEAAPAARLVVLGSAAEYGVTPAGQPVAEDALAIPVAPYGMAKLAGTQLVRLAVEEGRLDAVVLRVFNPIGPDTPDQTLLGRAAAGIRAALENRDDHIRLGPLGAHRDFVDVRDVAAAVVAAALADQVKEPVLNVGSGIAVPIRSVIGMLAEIAGFAGQVRELGLAPARSAAVSWIAADLGRIRRTLGWAPEHDLRSSVLACWRSV